MTKPKVIRTLPALRKAVAELRARTCSIALVPTMGALHDGHLTLVKRAREKAGGCVVSIFVNPTQFAPGEDLSRYPRDEAGDVAKLAKAGADLIWSPAPEIMYPRGFATEVVPQGSAMGLEADVRPMHFAGVATVCTKLFSQVQPDFAIFGEKDYQQLCVVRQIVRDLDLPMSILGVPTVREKDGLARSSRNVYLTADERCIAPTLHQALIAIAAIVKRGGLVNKAIEVAKRDLVAFGFSAVDYIEVRETDTLLPHDPASKGKARVLGAARLGKTRLIDNVAV